ncbi:MAG TPA: efflux RND transporter periplasmic adaptor subunit [Gammaproteobacteria bacterium]|nr:efflux RND transporter periplasmic adaptor subunit [Gammaproteobacteria bacterium]
MSKQMAVMLICMFALFGAIFGYKFLSGFIYYKFMMGQRPQVNVSAMQAEYQDWQPRIKASGSLRAVQGINVTSEVAGIVRHIHFKPGASVKENDLLIELNTDVEVAELHSLEATAQLAKITYERDKTQFKANVISKSALETDEADLKNKEAKIASQVAIIAKKTLRAPFAGRLGVSLVNLGQYVNPGDNLVTLQAIAPVYLDFFLPQKMLNKISTGLSVSFFTDADLHRPFIGKITTVNPIIDLKTRNVEVEATLTNAELKLLPGMFGTVEVDTGEPQRFLTLPQTAISFNPYGEIVYIAKETGKDKKGNAAYVATQVFVKVGETRGDQIAILEGVKEGDWIVTSGQLKIKNGTPIIINNTVVPSNNPTPIAVDE